MSTFREMKDDLLLLAMSQLQDSDIGRLLNKAQREEVETQQWSYLFKTGVIWGIPDNTVGSVSLVNGSPVVNCIGGIFPTSFPDYAPPENWVLVAGSQYMPLNVKTFVSPTQLLLTEPWGDLSQSNVNFNLRPQFYSVPGAAEIYEVRQILPVLPISRNMLTLMDPARLSGTSTPSVAWAFAGYDNMNNARAELWLRPGGIEAFVIEFRERFRPMNSDNDRPQVPSNVIEQKALMYMYYSLFASSANQAFKSLGDTAQQLWQYERDLAISDDSKRQLTATTSNYAQGYELYEQIDSQGPPGANVWPKG
jgi:hypothetical protein